MSAILITRGAGFIGSHGTEAYVAADHRVLALDDLASGSIENLARVRSHDSLKFIPESVTERGVPAKLMDLMLILLEGRQAPGLVKMVAGRAAPDTV